MPCYLAKRVPPSLCSRALKRTCANLFSNAYNLYRDIALSRVPGRKSAETSLLLHLLSYLTTSLLVIRTHIFEHSASSSVFIHNRFKIFPVIARYTRHTLYTNTRVKLLLLHQAPVAILMRRLRRGALASIATVHTPVRDMDTTALANLSGSWAKAAVPKP